MNCLSKLLLLSFCLLCFGCSPELDASWYADLARYKKDHPMSAPLIKEALDDGKITHKEREKIVRDTTIMELKQE